MLGQLHSALLAFSYTVFRVLTLPRAHLGSTLLLAFFLSFIAFFVIKKRISLAKQAKKALSSPAFLLILLISLSYFFIIMGNREFFSFNDTDINYLHGFFLISQVIPNL